MARQSSLQDVPPDSSISDSSQPISQHPSAEPSPDLSSETSRNRLQELLVALAERAKSFLESTRTTRLADKTCNLYLGKRDKDARKRCRQALQLRINLDPEHLLRFFRTSVGVDMLHRLGTLFHWAEGEQSHEVLQGTLVETATHPDGLSVLDLLSKIATFPLNTDRLLLATKRFEQLIQATQRMVETIHALAQAEAEQEAIPAEGLKDKSDNIQQNRETDASAKPIAPPPILGILGDAGVDQQVVALRRPHPDAQLETLEQTLAHGASWPEQQSFYVLLFKPRRWRSGQTPVVVMSHGLGSQPEDMAHYAEYLASYGYLVAVPQHSGSDAQCIRQMLEGQSNEVFQMTDFVNRPLDVTAMLDYLEQHNQAYYKGRLNLKSVGVVGHSFGGYTALALAGGSINFDKLEMACGPIFSAPNPSLFLQCRALALPRTVYNLRDRRVKAIVAVDSVGSEVFGPEGLSHIHIPVMLTAGSEDRTTPAALEQIRVFPWLPSSERYLILIEGKSHINDLRKLMNVLELELDDPDQLKLPDMSIPDRYLNVLSLAFFEVYLAGHEAYRTCLRSHYVHTLSRDPYPVSLISAASSPALEEVLEEVGEQLVG